LLRLQKSSITDNDHRFLWVEFQLHDLCDAESDYEIKQVLNNLPRGLHETYDRLLGRIKGAERQELVKRMFQWIICARQPIHIDQLKEGISFSIGDKFWEVKKSPTDILRLIRYCSNLIIVDEQSKTAQFAHYTVQEYLLANDIFSESRSCPSKPEQDEIALSPVCVVPLSFTDHETKIVTYGDNSSPTTMKNGSTTVFIAADSGDEDTAKALFRHEDKRTQSKRQIRTSLVKVKMQSSIFRRYST